MDENNCSVSTRCELPGVFGKAASPGMTSGTVSYYGEKSGIIANVRKSRILAAVLMVCLCFAQASSAAESLSILFLGDRGQHQPSERALQLIPVMKMYGIDITYTENLNDLNAATLARFDGLIIYADQDKIESAQEKALLDFVAGGKGFIPIHCASYCFINSPKYVALVGAQFKIHSVGVFRTRTVNVNHPVMKGLREFETRDETYVHTNFNRDCIVLQVRREGDRDEPWTWVRTHGRGRVFYTAYGHGDHTWDNPEFLALLERGVRWACGDNRIEGEDNAPK